MRKDCVIKWFSAVLAVWYLLCVVGFDIHTCNCSGRSYMVSLLGSSATCATIHATNPCHEGVDVSHHDSAESNHASVFLQKGCCCSNDVMLLGITGIDRHQQHTHHIHCSCICELCPELAEFTKQIPVYSEKNPWQDISLEKICPADDILVTYSVFRI